METNQQEKKSDLSCSNNNTFSKVLIAALLIFVGIVSIGQNLGLFDTNIFRILFSWQMLLIAIGIILLFKRRFWGGFIVFGLGIIYLVTLLTGYSPSWVFKFWPIIFIVIGIRILLKRKPKDINRQVTEGIIDPMQETNNIESGFVICNNTFGSIQQIVLDPVFKGAQLRNTFGGTILDLRRTKLEAPETYIDIDCTFGGIEIYLPSDWSLRTQVSALIGGCDDKRFVAGAEIDREHTLIIRGNILFGGIEFKS